MRGQGEMPRSSTANTGRKGRGSCATEDMEVRLGSHEMFHRGEPLTETGMVWSGSPPVHRRLFEGHQIVAYWESARTGGKRPWAFFKEHLDFTEPGSTFWRTGR